MRVMRSLIHEFNVYRWAGRMLLDAATMRRRGRLLGRSPLPHKHTRASDVRTPAVMAVDEILERAGAS
jgi:hypothetical protein